MTVTEPIEAAVETGHADAAIRRAGIASSLTPIVVGFAVCSIVLLLTNRNPLDFFHLLGREAFGGSTRVSATLASATPLLFSGVATAVAFRSGYFNIGVEGSFIAGAFTAAVLGSRLTLTPVVTLFVLAVAAALSGMIVALGPAWLKAYRGVDEVVVTLMGNFVVVGVCGWLLQSYFLSRGTGNASTDVITPQAELPSIVAGTQFTAAAIVAAAVLVAVFWWLQRHVGGFEVRMTGANPHFAGAVGIDVRRVVVRAALLSGAIGGLGGWGLTCGVLGRYVDGAGRNLGFTGIAVALLGRGRPVGLVGAAIGLGALSAAGPTVQLFSDVPLDIIRVIQGSVMMAAVLELRRLRGWRGWRGWRSRRRS